MISSIFYFAETEQEYLDNFNRHQVKPYTIVFCKDTKSLWKNGIRYGGNTTSEITDQVDDIIDRTITPLLNQLNQAVADAGDAADAAEQRLTQISTQMDGAIEDLQNAIDAEKTRLDNKVAEINDDIETRIQSVLDDYQNLVDNFEDNVAEKIESLLDDAEWVQENMPQEEVTWDSTWDQNVDNRMQLAGYWDIDPETGEKTTKWSKLQQNIDGISTEVSNLTESVNGDIEAVNTRIDQTADSITSIASSVSNIDGRLSTAESTITQVPDAIVSAVTAASQTLNGNIATAKSEVIQKASEIVQTVTGVTVASDGTVTTSNADLSQQIADNGDAITQLRTDWSNANLDTKDVLEWMYSGLTTKAGESGTFNDLVSAATSGDHSAISNILSLVEKIPTYQVDPQTGEPLEDEHGNYIYATDSEGNIIYQTNPDGSYKYRAKSSLTSAVDSAISGIINDTNSDYASTQMLAALGNNFAAWNAAAAESGSSIEGIVTHDNFAGELKSVAAEDWAQTGIAAKLRVPKYDENGDPVYDEDGNPVYEEISDAIGSIQTRVSSIDGVENVTNTIDARVSSALSTFEQNVNDGTACTTLVNRVNSDNEVLSGLVSKVTGDTSSNTMLSKVNGMTAGVVTTANLELAVAGLITEDENTSLASAILSKIDTAVGEATAQMAVKNDVSAASIVAKVNGAGSEINLNADKINFTGYANFVNAVKAVDLDVLGLTQSDVNGIVQAKLEEGNATFSGDVVAKTLTAGDPNAMHITTEEGEIKFVNADGVAVARFVTNGNGLEIFLLDENGDEFYLDWSNWSSSAEYEVETFYELRYDAVEEHASIERIQLYLSDGEYYTKPNPNSRLTQQLNLYEMIDDKSSVINNYSSQYGENQQVIYLKTTALKTTENYSSSCVQEIPISNVMTFKNVTVSSSGKQDTDIYVYATNFRMPEQPIPYTQFGLEINISNTSWKRVPQFISQPSTSVGTGCLVTIGEVIHNLLANTTIDAVKSCEVVTSLRPTSNRFTASVSYDSYPNQWNVVDN